MGLDSLLPKLTNFLSSQPIDIAWVFGSFARGEERIDSDVDIMVKYTEGTRLGLFGIVALTEKLEQILGKKVDLVEQGTLFPRIEKEVEKQKIMIYERRTQGCLPA